MSTGPYMDQFFAVQVQSLGVVAASTASILNFGLGFTVTNNTATGAVDIVVNTESETATIGTIYQAGATSGSGDFRVGDVWGLYGATSGDPAVASVSLFTWNGNDATIGALSDFAGLTIRNASAFTVTVGGDTVFLADGTTTTIASEQDIAIEAVSSFWIKAGGGIKSIEGDENDLTVQAPNGELALNGSLISEFGGTGAAQGPTFTQTYSTSGTTVNPASTSAFTGVDNAQGGTPYATVADLNQLRTDLLQAIGVVNAIIDRFQLRGTFL